MQKFVEWLVMPPKFRPFVAEFGGRKLRLLDVGCGNNSASKTKRYFPNAEYHGIDVVKDYNQKKGEIELMDKFYNMDISKAKNWKNVPDGYFDIVMCSHILEHMTNGEEVITEMVKKMKLGGMIYIEVPSPKSIELPTMYYGLSKNDEHGHVRVYTVADISNALLRKGVAVKGGRRKDPFRILAMPIRAVLAVATGKPVPQEALFDYFGYANYFIGQKRVETEKS